MFQTIRTWKWCKFSFFFATLYSHWSFACSYNFHSFVSKGLLRGMAVCVWFLLTNHYYQSVFFIIMKSSNVYFKTRVSDRFTCLAYLMWWWWWWFCQPDHHQSSSNVSWLELLSFYTHLFSENFHENSIQTSWWKKYEVVKFLMIEWERQCFSDDKNLHILDNTDLIIFSAHLHFFSPIYSSMIYIQIWLLNWW